MEAFAYVWTEAHDACIKSTVSLRSAYLIEQSDLPPEEGHSSKERDIPTDTERNVEPPKGSEMRFFKRHYKERQATTTVWGNECKARVQRLRPQQPLYRDVLVELERKEHAVRRNKDAKDGPKVCAADLVPFGAAKLVMISSSQYPPRSFRGVKLRTGFPLPSSDA